MSNKHCTTTGKPCPQCPFARTTPKTYLDTMGDNGERFVGQASGMFSLPCHMPHAFKEWYKDPSVCVACAGAAIYRSNVGYDLPSHIPRLPADHETVFSSPEELLAHHRGISLEEATARLKETTPDDLRRIELLGAYLFLTPKID